MTSGGSTGRPKLIVSANRAAWDPDSEYLQFSNCGCILIPGPLYHNGPFSWAFIALFKGNRVVVTTRFGRAADAAIDRRPTGGYGLHGANHDAADLES